MDARIANIWKRAEIRRKRALYFGTRADYEAAAALYYECGFNDMAEVCLDAIERIDNLLDRADYEEGIRPTES
jgi:hypothetical protein